MNWLFKNLSEVRFLLVPWNKLLSIAVISFSLIAIPFQGTYAYSEGILLIKEMENDDVLELQNDLKKIGFFEVTPTGYYGDITFSSVINFQKSYNLLVDGIAGPQTIGMIQSLKEIPIGQVSRGGVKRDKDVLLLPWFEKVNGLFNIGDIAVVTDIDTGITFQVTRTYGSNHADVETITSEDTEKLKTIAGGEWNWIRRAIIVEVNGYQLAASMTARPHAGRDDQKANAIVSRRSGGYGKGQNLDAIKNNKMDGHFDIHFLDSRTHGTNRVNQAHQQMIQKAYNFGK